MANLAYTSSLVVQSCITCGTMFGVEANLDARLRETHRTFHCPNGHSQMYTGKTEAEQLRDKLAAATAREDQLRARLATARDDAQHQKKRVQGYQGALNKVKKRVGNGVCPCCQRTFKDLARHMKSKHPAYSGEVENG